MIPVAEPDITQKEAEYVKRAMLAKRLSMGPYTEKFEEGIAKLHGVEHAVSVSSGTLGLEGLVRYWKERKIKRWVTTPFTFIATVHAILNGGAEYYFDDIDEQTLNVAPREIYDTCTGYMPVDVFGLTAPATHNCTIRDACENFGNAKLYNPTDSAVLAFYPNKQVTTGEGGCVLTNDVSIAKYIKSWRNHGRAGDGFNHVGTNARMSELHAACGVAQLERWDEIKHRRNIVAERYYDLLSDCPNIILPVNPLQRSWFVFVIRVPAERRAGIMRYMEHHGVETKIYFQCLTDFPHIPDCNGIPNAKRISKECLAIPFYTMLNASTQDYVCNTLKAALAAP